MALLLALTTYQWFQLRPKIDWTPAAPDVALSACPKSKKSTAIFFGATSMLGKYIVDSFADGERDMCIVNFGRSKCARCDVNVRGDLRDTRHVSRVLDFYKPDTVLTSVKPPLTDMHYKVYIELNLLSMLELIRAAKRQGVRNFIYVGSIAAAGHYEPHVNASEADPQPLLTDYEAPYDVSKRIAEDELLRAHDASSFTTVSLRTGGIIGGPNDPYDFYLGSFPFVPVFDVPSVIDANYAGNIGDALVVVHRTMRRDPSVGGQFYYYTGEHNSERFTAETVAEARGVPLVQVPMWTLELATEWWHWARWDPDTYSTLDLLRMALVPQMFDNSKFHKTFADFKARFTMRQALLRIYAKGKDSADDKSEL